MARTVIVTAADVDVFHIAAAQMGDATQWHRIMAVNGLSDPNITAMVTLIIPVPDASQTGGVPSQT